MQVISHNAPAHTGAAAKFQGGGARVGQQLAKKGLQKAGQLAKPLTGGVPSKASGIGGKFRGLA
jgi:hypothetical protein